jgi:hypothetical protein
MARMKQFFIYFILVLLFFVVSQILIYVAINTNYKYKSCEILSTNIQNVEVQATAINGFTTFTLNDYESIKNEYIKLVCYTKNNVLAGEKYIKIEELQTNDKNEFEIRFNYNKVNKAVMEIVDEV